MIRSMQNQTNSNGNQENTPYHHPTGNAFMQQPQMNLHFQQQQYQPMIQQPLVNMTNQQFHPFQANNKRQQKGETVREIKEVVHKIKATSNNTKASINNTKEININGSTQHNSTIQIYISIAGLMVVAIMGDLNALDRPMDISRELLSKTRWEGV
eukprot:8124224-Ditylum_brightwellii.AAC.1